MKKQFIVSIFINNNQVYSDCEYTKEITAELEEAVKRIGDCNADIILVSVSAETAEQKEASIALLKKIVSVSEIPVTVKFPVKRTEDVKKVLYTNAKSVILKEGILLIKVSPPVASSKALITSSTPCVRLIQNLVIR